MTLEGAPQFSVEQIEAAKTTLGFNTGNFRPKTDTPWSEVEASLSVIDTIPQNTLDLRTQNGIAIYMLQATNGEDWKKRTEDVQKANGGTYPSFWFGLITGNTWSITGNGIVTITQKRWGLKQEHQKT